MSKPRMPWLPWYPSDFAGATRDWPLVARGIYRELLDAQWDLGSIPADQARLQEMVRATTGEWRRAWPYVQPKFELSDDGRLRNEHLEDLRKRQIGLHERRSAGAAMTNKKRWGETVVPLRDEESSSGR